MHGNVLANDLNMWLEPRALKQIYLNIMQLVFQYLALNLI